MTSWSAIFWRSSESCRGTVRNRANISSTSRWSCSSTSMTSRVSSLMAAHLPAPAGPETVPSCADSPAGDGKDARRRGWIGTGGVMSLRGEGAPASHPARTLAIVVAAVYLAVGIVGFLVTGFDRFAAVTGEKLLGIFELNPLHNLVHIVVGVRGLALA